MADQNRSDKESLVDRLAVESVEPVESEVMDNLVSLPDIPIPETSEVDAEIIEDKMPVAFKFGFIGAGQAGSRIAYSLYKLGYRRVCCVNTNVQDLAGIGIPEENKLVMDIGEGGAGKDPAKGKKAAEKYRDDIYDLMRRSFGKDFDRIFVCVGAGGGSGSGTAATTINIAREMCDVMKIENTVGAIVSLPKINEGKTVNANAHKVVQELFALVGEDRGKLAQRSLSPLIMVDNERISNMYPGLAVSKFWNTANSSITGLFHLFNSIACQDSDLTTFDKADFKDILDSGVMTYGACPVANYSTMTEISKVMRENLARNVLVGGFDISKASVGACIFIGSPDIFDSIPQSHLEHGFDTMVRIMSGGTLHRGIYKGSNKGLVVYTALSELGYPQERMDEVAKIGGLTN